MRAGHSDQSPKSSLTPTQSVDYLGTRIQTSPLRVFPTLKWIQKLSSLLQDFLSDRQHPLSVWLQLLGVMCLVSSLVPGARLRMRSLQLRLNVSRARLVDEDLVFWDDSLTAGSSLVVRRLTASGGSSSRYPSTESLFTDASDSSWGASLARGLRYALHLRSTTRSF